MQDSQSKPARRGFIFGAAAAGAAVAAVATLPAVKLTEAEVAPLKPAPENGGGYSLSDHVKRYYKTTRI
jgi:hypothetical protein